MPRTLIRPHHDEDRDRSLGWLASAWIEHFCRHGPGDVQGQQYLLTDEYTGFLADCYMQTESPSNNHLAIDSAFLSRPKGTAKSALAAVLALFEALGPCRFGGWARGGEIYEDPWGLGFRYEYQPGEPMGAHPTAPIIACMATEEGQVANVFAVVYFNLTDDECPLFHVPGVDAGVEKVLLPWGGEIRASTASSSAKDGGRQTFVVFDESHLYHTPELRRMYRTVTRNLRKRKGGSGTWYIETTTMFEPGQESIAELTYGEAENIREGRKKRGRLRMVYDHRWGVCDDLTDEDALREALRESFGDAIVWQDLDGLIDEFYDTRNPVSDSRRYWLNAQTSASDAWIAAHELDACRRTDRSPLKKGDRICLGLDGAVNDDSTAVVAIRLSDMHIFPLGVWEKPDVVGPNGWQVDREAVDACVQHAMHTYTVIGFYLDPAFWQDYADRWSAQFGAKMTVKAKADRPLEWWTNRPRPMEAALQRFREAIVEKRATFTPADFLPEGSREQQLAAVLRKHILNAKRKVRPGGGGTVQIGKDFHHSPRKIDMAMAAVLAWEAAQDAVATGVTTPSNRRYPAKRIR
jgi:hypothetical protein